MKYLIVSADDLGLSKSINEGIIRGYKEGVVTALNLLTSGEAFENAAKLLKYAKPSQISAHLALTETTPVTDSHKIRSLLAGGGRFHNDYSGFLPQFLLKRIDRGQVYVELKNQLDKAFSLGFPITSLSSHQHVHMFPGILEIFVKLAKEYKIPAIRHIHNDRLFYPYNLNKIFKRIALAYFDRIAEKKYREASILRTDNFLGFLDSGDVSENLLLKMLDSLAEGVTELVTHPGYISADVLARYLFHKNCEIDLAALTSPRVKRKISSMGIKLITFADFAKLV